jgi:D-alanyl-D-alanine carboxypeptidase
MSGLALRSAVIVIFAGCGGRPTGTLQQALDRKLAENAEEHGIAAQSVLVLRNGKTIYRGSHGLADRERKIPVRPDHLFPVFSVSKLFASVLIMQLVERGELDLSAPASRYLPDLPQTWRSITVAEFLNHVSGVPEYFEGEFPAIVLPPSKEGMFERLADKPMQFATGTDTRYTQTNFMVLGAILEARYRMPYRQIVTQRIVEPLALEHTYLGKSHAPAARLVKGYRGEDDELVPDYDFRWPEYAIVHAELYTTVDDLSAFLNALCQGRVVKPETLLRLWKPHTRRDGDDSFFASGWDYSKSGDYKQVGHDGGNKVRVRLLYRDSLASDTYAYIYLTTGSAENVWTSTLVESLMDVVSRYDGAR